MVFALPKGLWLDLAIFVAMHLQGNRLFAASGVVLSIGLIASAVGVVKEQWVALRFGIGDELEVFAMGLLLPIFVIGFIGSSISAVVVPAYVKARRDEQEETFLAETGALFQVFLVFLVALTCAISWIAMPYLASGFDVEKMQRARWVAIALAPAIAQQGRRVLPTEF